MGAVWLPICCASSVAFRKFTEINELLNSKLSIKIINEIKQSQLFKSAIENQDRITSSQIIKIIRNSADKNDLKENLGNFGFKRSFKVFSFKDYFAKLFLFAKISNSNFETLACRTQLCFIAFK
jgi:hypothetical protein